MKIKDFFSNTLYVQIWVEHIKVTMIEDNNVFSEKPLLAIKTDHKGKRTVVAVGNAAETIQDAEIINPFKHPRLLLAQFAMGEKLMQWIFHQLHQTKLFKPAPRVVIHPLEKLEGGLTDIERRAFEEMALGAGARDVVVYEGTELSIHNFDYAHLKKHYSSVNSNRS